MFFSKKKAPADKDNQAPQPEPALPDGEMEMVAQWGGFYTSIDEQGRHGIFRLLDLSQEAYDIQLFRDKFDHVPSLDEVKNLRPFIMHAPLALGSLLLSKGLQLVGHVPLDEDAISGYLLYLGEMGGTQEQLEDTRQRLITFSNKGQIRVKISRSNGVVTLATID